MLSIFKWLSSPPKPLPQPSIDVNSLPAGPISEDQAASINKEIYERNVELALRNRTLSVLRAMYEIISTSLGVDETAQKLIAAIITELHFEGGFIVLADQQSKTLRVIAASETSIMHQVSIQRGIPINKIQIPLTETRNACVDVFLQGRRKMTNSIDEVFTPLLDSTTANQLQQSKKIETVVVDPIIFAGKVIGVLALGLNRKVSDLSRAERDTLRELIDVVAIALERSQIYADLKNANERLKELDLMKDEFVSIASHELRTPMTAVKSYLWMVLNNKAEGNTQKIREYLERAYTSTERLISLVNDMLDVSRIESGRIKLTPVSLDLRKLAEEVSNELLPKATEKSISLSVDPATLPFVFADADKIHQVLINLVGNAIKFTPNNGSVKISLVQQGTFIVTKVIDNGSGISPEDQQKLFQKFSRIEISPNAPIQASGTGLGLYICKQIIELLGGKVGVESQIGHGSTFWFSLPIEVKKP